MIYAGSVLGIVHTVALCGLIFFFGLGMSFIGMLFQFGSMEKANLDYQADADKSLALRSKEDEK